ncbi:ABC transporter ATP-binding protein [Noviherbaspirillum malthae]|jgi:branched-chain amino acid transport system ATP-binding protein|uniref:ABC transporter ATP-binding protein n=1 Tax=Noviherbaspirillum malthae TaxID=1260987 RepID=UPI00188FDA9F|nr:ABC transporter ATP-binding protein [Noviherbaspirillum malthae]
MTSLAKDVLLKTVGVKRMFGGLAANDNVSIEIRRGQVHAVLGPNGAGKSTLINLLSGDLACSGGSILYRGQDITHLSPDSRSRMGIGRSYQKTSIFPSFTVFENCRLSAQSRHPRSTAVWSNASTYPRYVEAAEKAMHSTGLISHAYRRASDLSHGEQRQLELAIVLCTEPDVLLLDEPLAGMGLEESARMIALLKTLVQSHAILLVEHDMDAVFSIADVITVMVNGVVLQTGFPDEIRSNSEVQRAYFGH